MKGFDGSIVRNGAVAFIVGWVLMSSGAAALAQSSTNHAVTFQNNCTQPIWLAANGSSDLSQPFSNGWELAPACSSTAPCPSGSTCLDGVCSCTQKGNSDRLCQGGLCNTNGQCATSVTMNVPAGFQGRFWGRTGCTSSGSGSLSCVTGDCNGKEDCTGSGANNATLWEESLGALGSLDNYDVSLVTGYNVPIDVQAEIPTDTLGWTPSTTYYNGEAGSGHNQSVITASAGDYTWLFNETGPDVSGASGTTVPDFSTQLKGTVGDPDEPNPPLIWTTTSSTCQSASCVSDLLQSCPANLVVKNGTTPVACTNAAIYCADGGSDTICTTQNNSFYNCVNNVSTETDQFGHPINLESANAGAAVCFNASDCPPGTSCISPPKFVNATQNTNWPAGAGICMPGNGQIPQNGGCTSSSQDTQTCPAPNFTFPFPDYQCATVTNDGSGQNVSLCLPPVTAATTGAAAFGNLIWNADNFTATAQACSTDSDCSAGQYCLEKTVNQYISGGVVQAQSVGECQGSSDSCVCNSVKYCTADADCTGGTKCQDSTGAECAGGTCLCQVTSVYTGTCGPPNVNWQNAILAITGTTPTYLDTFKTICPSAYSYQFDDVASDWTCNNTADTLVNYNVTFCGVGGKGS